MHVKVLQQISFDCFGWSFTWNTRLKSISVFFSQSSVGPTRAKLKVLINTFILVYMIWRFCNQMWTWLLFIFVTKELECYGGVIWWTNELTDDKINKMICVPSEDSDQPGHPPSLIRVFAVCSVSSWGPNLSSSRQQRLIRLGAQIILSVLSCCSWNALTDKQTTMLMQAW